MQLMYLWYSFNNAVMEVGAWAIDYIQQVCVDAITYKLIVSSF